MREDGGVATAIGINKNPPLWMLLVGVTKQHKNVQNHSKTIHESTAKILKKLKKMMLKTPQRRVF